jgi:hypothetical protein
MRVFKFNAKKKARYFEESEICYIAMESVHGCTIRITASSNKITSESVPEKVKEFNKAMN